MSQFVHDSPSLLQTVLIYSCGINNDTDFHFQVFSSCDNKISGHIICILSLRAGCGMHKKPDVLSRKQETVNMILLYLVIFGYSGADVEEGRDLDLN